MIKTSTGPLGLKPLQLLTGKAASSIQLQLIGTETKENRAFWHSVNHSIFWSRCSYDKQSFLKKQWSDHVCNWIELNNHQNTRLAPPDQAGMN